MQVASGPEQVQAFRLLALKGALGLEVKGLKKRGQSAFSIIKKEFKLKGSKESVLNQFIDILKERGILGV